MKRGAAIPLVLAACAPNPEAPTARPTPPLPPRDAGGLAAEPTDAADAAAKVVYPPAPTDFPAMELMARRLEYLRTDPIDPEWAPLARAALTRHLAGRNDPSVYATEVECRTRWCFIGLVTGVQHRWPLLPPLLWSGHASYAGNTRPDGREYVFINFRHPRDYPDEPRRVSSYAGPLEDEACHGATIAHWVQPLSAPPGCRGGIEFPTYALCMPEAAQPCTCGCSLRGVTLSCALRGWTEVCLRGEPLNDRAVHAIPGWVTSSYSTVPDDSRIAPPQSRSP